ETARDIGKRVLALHVRHLQRADDLIVLWVEFEFVRRERGFDRWRRRRCFRFGRLRLEQLTTGQRNGEYEEAETADARNHGHAGIITRSDSKRYRWRDHSKMRCIVETIRAASITTRRAGSTIRFRL